MCAVATADRGFTWCDEETSLLLKLWGANDAQTVLTGNKRNFVVYEKISEKMNSLGFIRTASQCREKIKRMKREYTLTKQYNAKTTGPKKLMRFYDQFERILLEKQSKNQRNTTLKTNIPGCNLEFKTDSSRKKRWEKRSDKRTRSATAAVKAAVNAPSFAISETSDNLGTKDLDGNPWAPAVVLIEGDTTATTNSMKNSVTASAGSSNSVNDELSYKKKQKIASRMALFKSMMDSMTMKFLQYQEKADCRFLAEMESLEKEKTAADENIKKMWYEFEEKRRKDDQEHESNVISAFKEILCQAKTNHIS